MEQRQLHWHLHATALLHYLVLYLHRRFREHRRRRKNVIRKKQARAAKISI